MAIPMIPARRKALDAEKKRYINDRLREFTRAVSTQADTVFGGTPFRVSFRVSVKKPAAYYQAVEEAVRVMLNRRHLLTCRSKELWDELDTRVKAVYGPDAVVDKTYWYKPLTDIQLAQIQILMKGYAFDKKVHTQLNLIADLIRCGPDDTSTNVMTPTGGETINGPVRFIGDKQVVLRGESRAIRWRRGKPYIRNSDGTEENLYTLLQGMGVEQATAAAWVKNASDQEQKLLDDVVDERQRKVEEKLLDLHLKLDADVIPAIVNNFRSIRRSLARSNSSN